MKIEFTKMQGCGNDYVYISSRKITIPEEKKAGLVKEMSDRHFGIGSDGVIFINPSELADFEMEMWNADGTRAEMCGNGIRCVAKYVYDKGLTDKTEISVVSAGKIKYLQLFLKNREVDTVRVNMGKPELEPDQIPMQPEKAGAEETVRKAEYLRTAGKIVSMPVRINGTDYPVTCVSMGNPHAVVFMDDVKNLKIEEIGPFFENHKCFPKRTNTEFVRVEDRKHVDMRVWERGTGETLACGTGCCATAVACVLNGLTDDQVTVKLLGGELLVEWDRENDLVYMTGPAVTVYEGEWQS